MPVSHGFSKQSAISAAKVETAGDHLSVGSSMVVLVIRTLMVEDSDSVAPFGALLARNWLSRMSTLL